MILTFYFKSERKARHYVSKEKKKQEKRLHIRIDEQLHERIKNKADFENRTISNYVINLIKKDLEENKN